MGNAVSGSWAGGNLFVLSGSGLVPFGGQATVFVTFGEAPYSMGCTIVEVSFDYISCMVPDFSTYKSGQASKQVPVAINLGYDQVSPILDNGNVTYTYDDALTASAETMTPSAVSSSEAVVIEGSNFGASVKVFLRNKNAASKRRRRSLPALPVLEHETEETSADDFFVKLTGKASTPWKCLHGVACDHEAISTMSEEPTRYRREADPNFWRYEAMAVDVSTPILAFLLIKGGTLMFDGENAEIELQSKYILLVEGGILEIGTEEEPYESKAIITMHGNTRCTEMPVFGCKYIGVRNGTLEFHGEYVPVTWTHLAATASAGDTEITLKQPVTWKVGDHIALATTGDRSSMKENEEHYIADISADGYIITLVEPLKYQHISIEQTFGDRVVESRGEVALLTRSILIRGNMNEEFVEVLPACEEEFDSGAAFSDAMQTCFAGKFGEELGSDEMGAIIIVSPKYKDQGLVEARIEYVEFSNVGQAFRVGRYPIHFHLPGNMSTSYVRGVALHHSNNRACTLHDVSNLIVEHNVAYNVKGLTFFLEDGIEEYNTIQYNLAVFTRMPNSLLNPDINPASFWIVNPNNKFRHNSCAGGTHFCFWLRPAKVPDGPSWTRNYCPC